MIKYVLLFCLIALPVQAAPCFWNKGQDHCLIDYVKNQDLDDIRKSLDKGANPNAAFETALNTRNQAVVKLLLEYRANVEQKTSVGGSALFYVLHHKIPLADLLLNFGANPNALDNRGNSILARSVLDYGDFNFARLLLKRGARINAKDKQGETALIKAMREKKSDKKIAFLLQNKADVKKTGLFLTALKQNRPTEILDLLLKRGIDIEEIMEGRTALIYACENGSPAQVSYLLKKNASVLRKGRSGKTPLMAAAYAHQPASVLQALIAKGSKINQNDDRGRSAVMYAASHGTIGQKLETIVFLQKNGAKISGTSKSGETLADILRMDKKVIGDMRYWKLMKEINEDS